MLHAPGRTCIFPSRVLGLFRRIARMEFRLMLHQGGRVLRHRVTAAGQGQPRPAQPVHVWKRAQPIGRNPRLVPGRCKTDDMGPVVPASRQRSGRVSIGAGTTAGCPMGSARRGDAPSETKHQQHQHDAGWWAKCRAGPTSVFARQHHADVRCWDLAQTGGQGKQKGRPQVLNTINNGT